jgi:NTE family protein
VARQAADLGVPTVVVSPDRATRKVIGAGVGNMLDPARRAAAARAGRAKAATEAAAVAAVWNDRRDGSAHPERSGLHRGR